MFQEKVTFLAWLLQVPVQGPYIWQVSSWYLIKDSSGGITYWEVWLINYALHWGEDGLGQRKHLLIWSHLRLSENYIKMGTGL